MGDGTLLLGENSGFSNRNAGLAGTVLQFAAGRTGIWFDSGQASTQGTTEVITTCTNCGLENLSLLGAQGTDQQSDPTKFVIPSDANLPIFDREISKIQRQNRVLSVMVALMGNEEGLTQQVGATVKISGVTGDPSMNGICTISQGLTPPSNPNNFQCAQLGDDSGPFTTPTGMVSLPTTGPSDADGIRICQNFVTVNRVVVQNFGRHGINLDSSRGCVSKSSNHFVISSVWGNRQSRRRDILPRHTQLLSGYRARTRSCTYNGLWAGEDQTNLGNTWEANEASYNGPGAADGTRLVCGQADCPSATIQTIARAERGLVKVTMSPSSGLAKAVQVGARDRHFWGKRPQLQHAYRLSSGGAGSHHRHWGSLLRHRGEPGQIGVRIYTARSASGRLSDRRHCKNCGFLGGLLGGWSGRRELQNRHGVAESIICIHQQLYGRGVSFASMALAASCLVVLPCSTAHPLNSWHGNFVTNGAVAFSTDILSSNIGVFQNLRDSGYSMHFQAGIYGNEHADQAALLAYLESQWRHHRSHHWERGMALEVLANWPDDR